MCGSIGHPVNHRRQLCCSWACHRLARVFSEFFFSTNVVPAGGPFFQAESEVATYTNIFESAPREQPIITTKDSLLLTLRLIRGTGGVAGITPTAYFFQLWLQKIGCSQMHSFRCQSNVLHCLLALSHHSECDSDATSRSAIALPTYKS